VGPAAPSSSHGTGSPVSGTGKIPHSPQSKRVRRRGGPQIRPLVYAGRPETGSDPIVLPGPLPHLLQFPLNAD
jgi:hypothetical protein